MRGLAVFKLALHDGNVVRRRGHRLFGQLGLVLACILGDIKPVTANKVLPC